MYLVDDKSVKANETQIDSLESDILCNFNQTPLSSRCDN